MKTTDLNKSRISAEMPEEPQLLHSVKQKTELQKKVNSEGLTQKMDRSINSRNSSPEPAHSDDETIYRNRDLKPASKERYNSPENNAAAKDTRLHSVKQNTELQEKAENSLKPEFKESAAFSRKRTIYHKRVPKPAPKGKYKLLKNNVVIKDKLLDQKQRTILNAVKLNRARLHFKRINLNKANPLKVVSSKKYSAVIKSAGLSTLKSNGKFLSVRHGVKSAAGIVGKPVTAAKDKLLSQRPDLDKSGDTGTEAMKLGLQGVGYAEKGARKIYNAVDNTIQHSRKIYNRINRSIANPAKRSLKTAKATMKSTSRTVKTSTKAIRNTAKMAERTAKASAKAVKTAAKAAKAAAQIAQKAVQLIIKVVKAAAQAAAKVVNLIIETAPYSLIIIGVIILLILIFVLVSNLAGGIGGTLTGAGGWCIDDTESNSPSDIYDNFERFIDEADSVIDSKVINSMQSKVSGFCVPITDDDEPHNIIVYNDPYNNTTYYPADNKDEIINPLIDEFKENSMDNEEYAKMLATLFVLMTREKQQAEGKTENEIYDFDFKREDFEEFIGEIVDIPGGDGSSSGNSCKWGSTYLYKQTKTESPVACPGRNCETEYRSGCHDAYYEDEEGEKHYYCTGHPYCPVNHTKMTVTLYTAEQYYNKSIEEIYNMTDTEKYRFGIAKEFIQNLLDDKEKGVI